MLDGRDPRNYSNFDVAKDTAVLVLKSWQKANSVLADYPVIVSEQEISRRVKVLYDKVVYFTCGNKKSPGKKKERTQNKRKQKEVNLLKNWINYLIFYLVNVISKVVKSLTVIVQSVSSKYIAIVTVQRNRRYLDLI